MTKIRTPLTIEHILAEVLKKIDADELKKLRANLFPILENVATLMIKITICI